MKVRREISMSSEQGQKDCEFIYHEWHERARARDMDALLSLYAEDAILESPLVPAILNIATGVLNGRSEIRRFLEEGIKRRPNHLVRWYRTGSYLCDGNTLVWEYPRETPDGNQLDILEFMEIKARKIHRHRIYWGWFGVNMLIQNVASKQNTP